METAHDGFQACFNCGEPWIRQRCGNGLCKAQEPPWRQVVQSFITDGRSCIRGTVNHWHECRLECGHRVDRPVRYGIRPTGWNRKRKLDDALPPPKRVRCQECDIERRKGFVPTVTPIGGEKR